VPNSTVVSDPAVLHPLTPRKTSPGALHQLVSTPPGIGTDLRFLQNASTYFALRKDQYLFVADGSSVAGYGVRAFRRKLAATASVSSFHVFCDELAETRIRSRNGRHLANQLRLSAKKPIRLPTRQFLIERLGLPAANASRQCTTSAQIHVLATVLNFLPGSLFCSRTRLQ